MFWQIGAGIAAFALKGDLSDNIKTNLEKGLDNYVEVSNLIIFKDLNLLVLWIFIPLQSEMYAKSWNLVQETFQCCGVEDYKDWQETFNKTTVVPDSCCRVPTENCGNDFDVKDIWEMGCFESFADLFVDNIGIVGGKTTFSMYLKQFHYYEH